MQFFERSRQLELLDSEHIPNEDLAQNMRELDVINTWLGGHRIVIKGVRKLRYGLKKLIVCEIGCGGGDNLAALVRWGKRHKIMIEAIGIDMKPVCIDMARNRPELKNATFYCDDYRYVKLPRKADIVFSSLFCHHFSNREIVLQFKWMEMHARLGFFISDLHRHWLAYYSIKWLSALFSKSYLVKHDAPLSVARAFTKKEWKRLLLKAELPIYFLRWQWAFRHLLVVSNVF